MRSAPDGHSDTALRVASASVDGTSSSSAITSPSSPWSKTSGAVGGTAGPRLDTHATGDPRAALNHHSQALAPATELGQPKDEARAHDGIATHTTPCRRTSGPAHTGNTPWKSSPASGPTTPSTRKPTSRPSRRPVRQSTVDGRSLNRAAPPDLPADVHAQVLIATAAPPCTVVVFSETYRERRKAARRT